MEIRPEGRESAMDRYEVSGLLREGAGYCGEN